MGDHPINFKTQKKIQFVSKMNMPKIFVDLYEDEAILNLFRRIVSNVGYKSLHLSTAKGGNMYGVIGAKGTVTGAHFDHHPFSCVWILQKAEDGNGEFMLYHIPPIKHETKNRTVFEWDWTAIKGIQTKNEDVLNEHQMKINVNRGDVYCFEGNVSLHETTPIVDGHRLAFVSSYLERENFQFSSSIQNYYAQAYFEHSDL